MSTRDELITAVAKARVLAEEAGRATAAARRVEKKADEAYRSAQARLADLDREEVDAAIAVERERQA